MVQQSHYKGDPLKFVDTPDECENCGIKLKHKKKYVILGKKELQGGHWTLKKKCKRCGHVNVADNR